MLYSIQAYRCFAVLLVVLYHGMMKVEREYGIVPLHDVFRMGFSGVHLFFVLSGFIIITAHIKDIGVPNRFFWYLKRRVIRLYPFYWIIFFAFGGWKLVSSELNIEDFILNAFLFMTNTERIISVSWTMTYEIIFYAIFAILILNKKVGTMAIAVWFASIVLNWDSSSLLILHPFNLLFIFGLVASLLCFHLKKMSTAALGIIAGTSFGLGAIAFASTATYYSTLTKGGSMWITHPPPVTIIGFGLASVLLILGSASPCIENFFKKRLLLEAIGNASYSIYLVHIWAEKNTLKLVKGINSMLGTVIGESQIASGILLIFVAAVAVLVGIAIHLKIERPLLSFIREKMNATKVK